jgi:hypothetical protein
LLESSHEPAPFKRQSPPHSRIANPVGNCQSPIQSAIANPVGNRQSPIASRQSPTPIGSRQSTIGSRSVFLYPCARGGPADSGRPGRHVRRRRRGGGQAARVPRRRQYHEGMPYARGSLPPRHCRRRPAGGIRRQPRAQAGPPPGGRNPRIRLSNQAVRGKAMDPPVPIETPNTTAFETVTAT